MLTEERFARTLALLEKNGSVTVQQLMNECDASESTIRRDLSVLAANHQLAKVHGGAVSKDMAYRTKDDEVAHRKEQNPQAKQIIGRYAAGLIGPEDFVYLDAGTTTECMIEHIASTQAAFVTNSVTLAKKLAGHGCLTYILSGEFKASTEAVVGPETVACLEKYNFTKGFFGTNGVIRKRGFSTPEMKEAMVKREAMRHSKECFVLADDSKFDQISSISFASFESAVVLTTNLNLDAYRDCQNIVNIEQTGRER